jgi:hypothetical protein
MLVEGFATAMNRQQLLQRPLHWLLGSVLDPNLGVWISVAVWCVPRAILAHLA